MQVGFVFIGSLGSLPDLTGEPKLQGVPRCGHIPLLRV